MRALTVLAALLARPTAAAAGSAARAGSASIAVDARGGTGHWKMKLNESEVAALRQSGRVAAHLTPLIGPYSSSNSKVVQWQLTLMKLAGIKGVVINWYGTRDDWGDFAFNLLGADEIAKQASAMGMTFTICYEDWTTVARRGDGWQGVEPTGSDRTVGLQHMVADFKYIREKYMPMPGFLVDSRVSAPRAARSPRRGGRPQPGYMGGHASSGGGRGSGCEELLGFGGTVAPAPPPPRSGSGAALELLVRPAPAGRAGGGPLPAGRGGCGLQAVPADLQAHLALAFLDGARPVAHLACASRLLRAALCDGSWRLRVGGLRMSRVDCAEECLRRASLPHLAVLRLDLAAAAGGPARAAVEGFVARLADCLADGALQPQALALRLAAFDAAGDRLRLGQRAWASLVRGLGAPACGRLRALELSFLPIKLSQALQPVAAAGEACLSFAAVLARMFSLEELVLTHDDIFGETALLLGRSLGELPRLTCLDLTRNRISRQAMDGMRAAVSPTVAIRGAESQTFAPC
ncbi:unnamed protein product [Prorocentrum cordatum]|uniref:Beta-galactosidase n=1 Tax=Prorocentrum cordatum TaxID=2364126 RepID=A0ABN9XLQ6_9DINO|nr:unnamed protein product [Polarella glacialis]